MRRISKAVLFIALMAAGGGAYKVASAGSVVRYHYWSATGWGEEMLPCDHLGRLGPWTFAFIEERDGKRWVVEEATCNDAVETLDAGPPPSVQTAPAYPLGPLDAGPNSP